MEGMARAPGAIKLLGEHAVLYGGVALSAAVELYATARSGTNGTEKFSVRLSDISDSVFDFESGRLDELLSAYKVSADIKDYVSNVSIQNREALPYAIIAGRLQKEQGAKLLGTRVTITSEIPRGSGCASSAACFTAFTVALASTLGIRSPDGTLVDIARDGDRITHLNKNAGALDVGASYYGGVVAVENGAVRPVAHAGEIPMVLIDTGPKRGTAEMIGVVAEQYKMDKSRTQALIEGLGSRARQGIAALSNGDMAVLGRLMTESHGIFKQLGVSTPRLDEAVELSVKMGAYGAKLSGGGGGGLAVALTDREDIVEALRARGFNATKAKISSKGAISGFRTYSANL
ncbi:MAG: mevalonate kinase [Candidatus Micrarchaeota archaeon]|nr:mevalonate kinase [Candidatus Micrarchaeota archaeon]